MNSCINNQWGHEEVVKDGPFKRKHSHAIEIVTNEICFIINVDGEYLWRFYHRIPFTEIKRVSVEGDIEIEDLIFSM